MEQKTRESVQEYYGKVLKTKEDLQSTACCTAEALPEHVKPIVASLHEETIAKFYGCGSPIPHALAGKTVLDLGCGSGRDAFVVSKLVGARGSVIGVDMTDEQLAVANKHLAFHMEQFGYSTPNVRFAKGYIEDLASCDIADESVDLVISNCVVNLSPDKERVFSEIFRVLKPGGELYFSDVFADRRIPEPLKQDDVMIGECLAGAFYTEDFRRMVSKMGYPDPRVVSSAPIELTNPDLRTKAGNIRFSSQTVRVFKVALEDRCEDFGQVATYKGTIPETPHNYVLDDHHDFIAHKPMTVCSNTANMLKDTRFAEHFQIDGDESRHFGLFDCGPAPAASSAAPADAGSGGACC